MIAAVSQHSIRRCELVVEPGTLELFAAPLAGLVRYF